MTSEPLRGVMIGAGYFAGFQAEGWTRIPEAEIVAVADVFPGRAAAFARKWGIPRSYEDVGQMLDREKPDFADIVTRPNTHLDLVRETARRRIHAICQKPMAPAWEQAVAMVEACRTAGTRLIVHENWRWQPWYREIKRLIERGVFGNLFHIEFKMRTGDGRGLEPYPLQPYFREMERLAVYEVVVHYLDTFRYLVGEITRVFCQIQRINPTIRAEDYALILLAFEQGLHGLIDANRISGPSPPEIVLGTFRLEGDRAAIRLSADGRLWLTEYGSEEVEHLFETSRAGYKGDSVRAAQQHYIDCLRNGQPSESEGGEYLKTVAAVFACYESVESGRPVYLSTFRKARAHDPASAT